jgi:antitoxin CcdA
MMAVTGGRETQTTLDFLPEVVMVAETIRMIDTHMKCAENMRMTILFDSNAPKRSVNLSINGDLLAKAKNMEINLSAALETALTDALRNKQRERWLEDNRQSIDAYNQYVEAHGVFSDGKRSF